MSLSVIVMGSNPSGRLSEEAERSQAAALEAWQYGHLAV